MPYPAPLRDQSQELRVPVGRTAQSLPAQVAERLLQAILDGELAPGARLLEIQLAEEHAVSRATIREALAHLERGHFVERVPRYGARVIEVDLAEINELYELRGVLLGLASERAARLGETAAIERFDLAVRALEELAAQGVDAPAYTRAVLDVQDLLIEMACSKWVRMTYDQISNQALWRIMVRNNGMVFASDERRKASAHDWRMLADALVARDPAASEAQARQLIRASGAFLQQLYERKTP